MYKYSYAHTDRQTAATAAAAYMQTKKQGGCSISDSKAFPLDSLKYLTDLSALTEREETILRIRII